jgi:hypothetical protein
MGVAVNGKNGICEATEIVGFSVIRRDLGAASRGSVKKEEIV